MNPTRIARNVSTAAVATIAAWSSWSHMGRRCVVEPADVLNLRRVGGQIAWASSANAAATRVVGGASRLSS
jgi:hypothetical protein